MNSSNCPHCQGVGYLLSFNELTSLLDKLPGPDTKRSALLNISTSYLSRIRSKQRTFTPKIVKRLLELSNSTQPD